MKRRNIMIVFEHRIRIRICYFMLVTEEMSDQQALKSVIVGREIRQMADRFEEKHTRRRIIESLKGTVVECKYRVAVTALAMVAISYCILTMLPLEFVVWS